MKEVTKEITLSNILFKIVLVMLLPLKLVFGNKFVRGVQDVF